MEMNLCSLLFLPGSEEQRQHDPTLKANPLRTNSEGLFQPPELRLPEIEKEAKE